MPYSCMQLNGRSGDACSASANACMSTSTNIWYICLYAVFILPHFSINNTSNYAGVNKLAFLAILLVLNTSPKDLCNNNNAYTK